MATTSRFATSIKLYPKANSREYVDSYEQQRQNDAKHVLETNKVIKARLKMGITNFKCINLEYINLEGNRMNNCTWEHKLESRPRIHNSTCCLQSSLPRRGMPTQFTSMFLSLELVQTKDKNGNGQPSSSSKLTTDLDLQTCKSFGDDLVTCVLVESETVRVKALMSTCNFVF